MRITTRSSIRVKALARRSRLIGVELPSASLRTTFSGPRLSRPGAGAELDRRGVAWEPIHAAKLAFDPADREGRYALVVNRMSPSAWTRGHGYATFQVLHYLEHLEAVGAPVLNGAAAYRVELSKARQCALFAALGVPFPRTRVVSHPAQLGPAAEGLRLPVLVKPNIGGSGAGIRSFDDLDELVAADVDFGLDGTVLIQEHLPADGGFIVRLEIVGGELLYAIRILLMPGSFNLCPADYCDLPGVADGVSGRGLPVEVYDPPGAGAVGAGGPQRRA